MSAQSLRSTRFEWMMSVRPARYDEHHQVAAPRDHQAFRPGRRRAPALPARTWSLITCAWLKARGAAAGDELRLAAQHARNAGDAGLRERALAGYVGTLPWGRADARTIGNALDAIDRERPGPYLAASVEGGRSEVARLNGRFPEARMLAQRACGEAWRSLGLPEMEAGYEAGRGNLELSVGDPAAALATLQRSDAILTQLGERGVRSTAPGTARAGTLAARKHRRRNRRDRSLRRAGRPGRCRELHHHPRDPRAARARRRGRRGRPGAGRRAPSTTRPGQTISSTRPTPNSTSLAS